MSDTLVISRFSSLTDTRPHPVQGDWASIQRILGTHMRAASKSAVPLWSPAIYAPDTTRAKANVIEVSMFVADLDGGTTPEEIAAWLNGTAFVMHSTYSHTPEHPKLRAVLLLAEPIPAAIYDEVWLQVNVHIFRSLLDPSTKDVSRAYFLPSGPPHGVTPVYMARSGHPLDWRQLPPLPLKMPTTPARPKQTVVAGDLSERRAQAMLDRWADDLAATAPGSRHGTLLRLARAAGGLVASGVLDADVARAVLLDACRRNGLVEEDGANVERTIDDGLAHGGTQPWAPDDLPDGQDHNRHGRDRDHVDPGHDRDQDRDPVVQIGVERSSTPTWPSPLEEAAYHGLAGDTVRAIGPHTEADPVGILVQMLLAFGNAVNRGPYFTVEASRHYPNEFAVLVGETAKARKGTSWDHVRALFDRVDEEWARQHVTGGLSSGEGMIYEVRDPIVKTEPIRERGRPTGEYEDVVVDPGVADKRRLFIEPEFARVLRVAGREGNTLSQLLRDAWDGRDLRTMTRSSPLRATGPHISLIGHVTGDEVRRELTTTDAASGLGNRFVWFAVRRARVLPFGGALGGAALNPLVSRLSAALDAARHGGEVGMDADAAKLFAEVYPELSRGKPGLLGAMIARGEAHVRRFAMGYALMDGTRMAGTVHLKAALALWRYAEASTRWVFGDRLGDPVADTILDALRRSGELTRSQINDLFSGHRSKEHISTVLNALAAAGLARFETRQTSGAPREVWYPVSSVPLRTAE
jgi:hypothetical protein